MAGRLALTHRSSGASRRRSWRRAGSWPYLEVITRYFLSAAETLAAAGVTCIEFALRSSGTYDVITTARQRLDERVAIGAGTVLNGDAAREAVSAARLLVCPHVGHDVLAVAADLRVPIYPGAWTASEIIDAWNHGASAVKWFPASGGVLLNSPN